MFFYGGALGALYTISLVLLGRRFKGADLSAASAMLAVMFCIGSFIWPSAGGAAMDRFGGGAMPVSLIVAYALFLVIVAAAWLRGASSEGGLSVCPAAVAHKVPVGASATLPDLQSRR